MAAEIEVYTRADGQFDWRLKSANGQILGGSSQGYTERNDAVEGVGRVIETIVNDILQIGDLTELAGTQAIVPVSVDGDVVGLSVEFHE